MHDRGVCCYLILVMEATCLQMWLICKIGICKINGFSFQFGSQDKGGRKDCVPVGRNSVATIAKRLATPPHSENGCFTNSSKIMLQYVLKYLYVHTEIIHTICQPNQSLFVNIFY